jgi:hypothetical protein
LLRCLKLRITLKKVQNFLLLLAPWGCSSVG